MTAADFDIETGKCLTSSSENTKKSVLSDFCEISSIHGLSHLVLKKDEKSVAKSKIRQFVWVCICVGSFCYMIVEISYSLKE